MSGCFLADLDSGGIKTMFWKHMHLIRTTTATTTTNTSKR